MAPQPLRAMQLRYSPSAQKLQGVVGQGDARYCEALEASKDVRVAHPGS